MSRKPNFLFLITDQHRADYLGCAGHRVLKTPHIDSIAATGTRFDNFWVATPVCMPNRATLLTGRFPSAHGLRYNGCDLSYDASTFVEALRLSGYRTAAIGKSHVQPMTGIPAQPRVDPEELGPLKDAWRWDGADYDHEDPARYETVDDHILPNPYYGYEHVDMVTWHGDLCSGHYLQWLRRQSPLADAWRDRSNALPHDYICPQAIRTPMPEEFYPTSFIRDRAVDWLDAVKNDEQPFFAFVSFPDPHHPFTPPGKYWDMYKPADFEVPPTYEAHKNPTPPMRWLHEQWQDGKRFDKAQEAFMVNERETREAMALTCGMIAMIDDSIGAIIAKLKATGRYDDTVIVFNADHGDYLGDCSLLLKGAIMRRSINNVPFIWSDPERRTPAVSHALASTADLAPTILARAGVKPYFGIQGKNLLGNLDGSSALRERLVVEFEDTEKRMNFARPAVVRTLLTESFRLTVYAGVAWGELYDLRDDPQELNNRWDDPAYAKIRAEQTEALMREMLDTIDISPRARRRA